MKKVVWIFVFCILLTFASMEVLASTNNEDRISILNNIDIREPLSGNAVVVFGNMDVKHSVGSNVVAVFGNIYINADVGGNVVAVLGNVSLGPQADIRGNVVSIGLKGIQESPGSNIRGDSIGISLGNFNLPFPFVNSFRFFGFFEYILFFIMILCSLLVISLAKERIIRLSYCVEDNIIRKVIIGLILLISFPIIIILMAITLIGVPILIVFSAVVFLMGFSALSSYIGRKVLSLFENNTDIYGEYLVGVVVFAILMTTIHFSWLIACAAVVLSLGLVFDAGFGKKPIGKDN